MKPVTFPQQTCVYAKDQPEYGQLPAHRTVGGIVTSCWSMTMLERIRILFGAKIYWTQMTFNAALQPISASLEFKEFQT